MANPLPEELKTLLGAQSPMATNLEYHGVELNLWIDECPVIPSHGMGNSLIVTENILEIGTIDGGINRVLAGPREYKLKFTIKQQYLNAEQHWFFHFNSPIMLGESNPAVVKFAVIGSPVEPVTLAGNMRLEKIETFSGAAEFQFEFVGIVPISFSPISIYEDNGGMHTQIPEESPSIEESFSASESWSLSTSPSESLSPSPSPSIDIPESESLSASGSFADSEEEIELPTTLVSKSPPKEENYDGPSLEEQAEQMQFELKKLLEKMQKKGIQPKRKVSFD
jgi:hypothetical protein